MSDFEILRGIHSPADVRGLSEEALTGLCGEIRRVLIDTVSQTGGHLASNLGTVELTVAIHKCFHSPEDSVIWDVGHQAYTHKLLTGRFDRFSTLRQKDGLSGFTRPDESEHDLFYSGHAGVAVSQAAGVAAANEIKGSKNYAVAVIGDGSFTGGMVYEALDAAGSRKNRLIVILNDNEMSISESVGSMARHLARVRAKPEYYRLKAGTERAVSRIPLVGKGLVNHLFRLKTALKNIIYSSSFFEDLGFRYIGPIDGHDIGELCSAMDSAKMVSQPVLLHVNTLKGKGYDFAELSPEKFHGISRFDVETGEPLSGGPDFSKAFGDMLAEFAAKDKRICAVTAAMSSGTGLTRFASEFPDRFFDVGIAEEHALTFCAGLTAGGLLPVFAVYSTFFQRCCDQMIHDAALQRRKLVIAVDRAGFVGQDGETHQGLYDVSMLAGMPGVTVYSPASFEELGHALYNAFYRDPGVVVIRYPRGAEPALPTEQGSEKEYYRILGNEDAPLALVTYGRLLANACEAAEELKAKGYDTKVIALKRIQPIDPGAVEALMNCRSVFFFEEGVRSGGIGERLAGLLCESGFHGRYKIAAVPDCFVMHADVKEQLALYGLDKAGIVGTVCENINNV